ncbi:MAG TPA: homoserine dehydrogenase [Phycisphaerae bacterium]|nr:homoserine dehydrogenase [Phycisphaerae bacterium]HPS52177.1 homoserine dehydrogenase [Phycisphaerae bacterium]
MDACRKGINVAIVGCGTVGGATARLLTTDRDILVNRLGCDVNLKYIVDLNLKHAKELGLPEKLFQTDFNVALSDPEIDVVVELVGGLNFARELIEKSLIAKKHVVTANKALLAHHGTELFSLARNNGVSISFEASCGGGIPIIQPLCCSLLANRIDAIYGIVNGTCNYLLTEMSQQGRSYADALREAQADGLAEADPTLDVAGIDTAHKLTILSSLAFGQRIDFDAIPCQGIDKLEICDIKWGSELGYVIKLLAIALRQGDGLCLCVRPAFISIKHPLAWVAGPFNAISVYGHAVGHTMFYGRGAGGLPTASSVAADIANIALGNAQSQFEKLRIWSDVAKPAKQLPVNEIKSRYYIRVMAEDKPGVLAKIADIFGRQNISIDAVLQRDYNRPDATRPVIITTHTACEGNVRTAIEEVDALDSIKAKPVCIGIVDEYPEFVK